MNFDESTGEMAAEVDTLGQAVAQVSPALVKEMLSQLPTFSVAVILCSFGPLSKDTKVLLPRYFEVTGPNSHPQIDYVGEIDF